MNISKIEGIGSFYENVLSRAGINTAERLLAKAANRNGRQELAEETGISERLILEWTNRADLMRVKGIGEEYSDLLEAAGVDTIRELSFRRPENLHQALAETSTHKKRVRRIPSLPEIRRWVKHAKSLQPMITY